jgi:glycosyltransferase involved in cell wall biosynthesis
MAGASVLVMPSFVEGFGIPALEAMTLGVPVIASRGGALPEVIGGAGLHFDATDPHGLADALDRVLNDSALRRDLSARGRARAMAYSWDQTAARTREAWALAIETRKARKARHG